jgi:hypothetical protein
VNAWRSIVPVLVATAALVVACGEEKGTSPESSVATPNLDAADAGPAAPAESPGPWAPSRALSLDRFALESALGVTLTGPAGAELESSTRWTWTGEGVDLRLEVRTAFDAAVAERVCAAGAGTNAPLSLARGTPTWTTDDAVYVTRGTTCVRVIVVRGARPDLAGAGAVAEALVAG